MLTQTVLRRPQHPRPPRRQPDALRPQHRSQRHLHAVPQAQRARQRHRVLCLRLPEHREHVPPGRASRVDGV